jgi:glutamyl-tRNA(Gln) amidotransferase subunit D
MEASGYRGKALTLLKDKGVRVGSNVIVKTKGQEYKGIIMPRYELADDTHIVIKLGNGYNIGISIENILDIVRIDGSSEERDMLYEVREVKSSIVRSDRARIALISTGGTIASKIDYRTGGVRAALTAEELHSMVPELSDIASIDSYVLFQEYSENITCKHWSIIADYVKDMIAEGYDGIIIAHGTDTMHYTSAALSFALQNLPIPVVLVGSQRSSDRPSSDAASNLIGATLFASHANVAGVFVAMHASSSDDKIAVHIGTRVRKNHTSSRDAFESIDINPIALIDLNSRSIDMNNNNSSSIALPRDKKRTPYVKSRFDERVALIKFHPNFDPSIIDYLVAKGYRGLIIEGTGLGHVSKYCFDSLRNAIEHNMLVYMTSQCIWGRLRMTVYDTGRDLLSIGVRPLNMLSEVAYAKLSWALANFSLEEAKEVMLKDIAMEFK